MQVVKIHQQVASEQGIITCIQQIYRDAGFRGFYRGFTTALPLDASRGMYLTAYELLKVQLAKLGHTCSSFVGSALEVPLPGRASLQMDAPSHGKATPAPMTSYVNPHAVESSASAAVASDSWNPESMSIRMAAAGLSGICCWLIIYPVDVVKSRLQSDYRGLKYSGASDCILQAYREGGIRVFYRGLVMNVIRAGPVSAATLSTYELVKDILLKKDASGNYTASFVTACAKSTDRV